MYSWRIDSTLWTGIPIQRINGPKREGLSTDPWALRCHSAKTLETVISWACAAHEVSQLDANLWVVPNSLADLLPRTVAPKRDTVDARPYMILYF